MTRKEPRFTRVSTQRESNVSRFQASKPKIRLASEITYQPSMYESSRPLASRVRTYRLLRPRLSACSCFAEKPITVSSHLIPVPGWTVQPGTGIKCEDTVMGFSAKQLQALRRGLNSRYVRTREANGRELSYIEGWYVISEANRIFGFDAWNRETIESRCVLARENRGSFLVIYTARVRISVRADGTIVIREGHGTGEGRSASPGEVHDTALKSAETDATKRALATFGKPFGQALYRSGSPISAPPVTTIETGIADAEHRAGLHP